MKTTILTLLALGTLTTLTFADPQFSLISNGHGQLTGSYRQPATASVALVVSGRGIGAAAAPAALKTESQVNGHGQTSIVYREVR